MPREPRMKFETMKPTSMMNPLTKNQVKLLGRIGCEDLARKIDEIVMVINLILKKDEEECLRKAQDEIISCRYCATASHDPRYCSVWGRTADKHVFEEKSQHEKYIKILMKEYKRRHEMGQEKEAFGILYVKNLLEEEHVFEEKPKDSDRCFTEGCDEKALFCSSCSEYYVSERNALIDELIQEVGMISHLFVTEKIATRYIDPEEVVKLLKSKKK